ncbi:2-dehydro-3-deoxygalactonokinase [Hydrogenophaga sp. BPS33]|uniref:2-dehydro-3-deoxygalactonokinase n=1 Tax=Hydrogenophaga sp. BPS33 TaxID=2651974 RepID=UPI00131F5046|nr:2-dehydro-3-deoxygalactonokinase [Hydrogenophaga sp. BPS33]QHE86912.1 2-dehydro-3-deoxygalactonokinase [Hydrogenophaga sp. BPS33]
MTSPASALIAIDWGTSNLRASLLDASGAEIETRATPGGVMAVKNGAFGEALLALCGDWIERRADALIASGMVGSRQGWKEAAYLDCPAGLAEAAAQLTRVDVLPDVPLHIVPGLTCRSPDGEDDVMRGEETQMWGADLAPGSICMLPGTHAKWAWIGEAGQVTRFATYMTGELYGLLTQHGILGRLMTFGQSSPEAFEAGVRLGLEQHDNATHVIFAARTAGLMGRVPAEGLPDYLSGILMGIEIASATRTERPRAVVLLGDDGLCSRYAKALELAGIASTRAADGATTRGQWRVAQAAGLVERQP